MSNPHLLAPASVSTPAPDRRPVLADLRLDPSTMSQPEITGARIAFAVSGLLALVLGTLILAWPEVPLAAVALLFGLYFVGSGVVRIVRSVTASGPLSSRVLSLLFGVLLLIAGIATIRNPMNSLLVLGLLIGLCWIVEGVTALVETAPDSSQWCGTLLCVISIAAGIVVLFAPLESLGVLVIVGGAALILSGVVQLVEAFAFGREARAASVKIPTVPAARASRDTD